MRIKVLIIGLIITIISSCEYSISYEGESYNKDMTTGLITIGSRGLTCEDAYLSDGVNKITKTTFSYGQKLFLNLNNIKGFKKIDGNAFPGMELLISKEDGDTVMFQNDLYENDSAGYELSPLLLTAFLNTATPLHSGNSYTFRSKVWDKKGEGVFISKFDFEVETNPDIKIESNGITYDEIYLFSNKRNLAITNGTIKLNENTYLLFEGLSGFKESEEKVSIEIDIKLKDREGNILFEQENSSAKQEYSASVVKEQVSPNVIINEGSIGDLITLEVSIWDKLSDHKISASTVLRIEE